MLYHFSIVDLFPYFLLYVVCLFAVLKKNNFIFKTTFVFVFLFTAIRYGIGYDYFNYIERIEAFDIKNFSPLEWMSSLLYYVSKQTFNQLFFIVNAFVCLHPIYFLSKKYSLRPALSFFAFITIPLFYLESLSIVRYSSALSLFLLSFYYLDVKKYSIYILICLLAGAFHASGYLAFLLLLLKLNKSSFSINIVIYIISIFLIFSPLDNIISLFPVGNNIFYIKLLRYLSKPDPQGGMMTLAILGIGFINLIFWKKISNFNPKYQLYLRFYSIGLLCWGLFSFNDTLSLRISSYFLSFIIFIIPVYLFIFKESRSKIFSRAMIYSFLSIFFASSFFIIVTKYKPSFYNRISTLPYQTVFYYKDYQNYRYRFQIQEIQ